MSHRALKLVASNSEPEVREPLLFHNLEPVNYHPAQTYLNSADIQLCKDYIIDPMDSRLTRAQVEGLESIVNIVEDLVCTENPEQGYTLSETQKTEVALLAYARRYDWDFKRLKEHELDGPELHARLDQLQTTSQLRWYILVAEEIHYNGHSHHIARSIVNRWYTRPKK